ncbi:hypothetical protein [Spirosoma sp. KUDC1026]|uniref:hypothetical protein n=1 Tax=Spirosoma sp. KUDC1026 TaxID=2745947 RepID=UPI00159B942C|nr:hypothetical protein [Spirosoma sp. KUDC1026]QKZ11490.1 hypothetical protein HU175_02110 [Spirosoma sp. KUDC1026]
MIQVIAIALLSLLAQLFLPWWSLAVVAFAVCFARSGGAGWAFLQGLMGVALVWLGYALFIHINTDGIFTGRMGMLLFKADGAGLPLLVTTLLSGLIGGLAGMSGYLVRQASGNQASAH